MTFPPLGTTWITADYLNIFLHNSFAAFFRYLNMAHDMDLAPSQLWFCKAIAAVLFTSSMCSTLFILSMTFERFYSIIRPHKAASFNTVKRAKICIVCIILFIIGYNSPLWLLSSQVVGQSRNCNAYAHAMNSTPGYIYYWSANILHFILPFLLLFMMNTVIIYTLSNRSKFRAECKGQGQSLSQGQGKGKGQIQQVIFSCSRSSWNFRKLALIFGKFKLSSSLNLSLSRCQCSENHANTTVQQCSVIFTIQPTKFFSI